MFSVSASPFNSRRRQLYGGWAASAAYNAPSAALYQGVNLADDYARDAKYAAMAARFSTDPAVRASARSFRSATKGLLARQRAAAKRGDPTAIAWVKAYNAARAAWASTYTRPPLSPAQKNTIFDAFTQMSTEPDAAQRAWLSLASRAPYTSTPAAQGITEDDLALLTTGEYAPPEYKAPPLLAYSWYRNPALNPPPAQRANVANQAAVDIANAVVNGNPGGAQMGD